MHPNTMKRTKTWVNGPMVWIGCVRCEKFWSDFVARTFALIAPVQPILHWVSCSNEMIPNPPWHYKTHQNMSLGSNGVDRVCSLWKFPMRLQGTNLCINCTSSTYFAPSSCSNETLPNAPNTTKCSKTWVYGPIGVDWECSLRKILMRLYGTNLCINCTSSTHFAPSFV